MIIPVLAITFVHLFPYIYIIKNKKSYMLPKYDTYELCNIHKKGRPIPKENNMYQRCLHVCIYVCVGLSQWQDPSTYEGFSFISTLCESFGFITG